MLSHKQIKLALLIRKVEEKFLELFSQGKLNGTVHTSVGQELSAVAFAGALKQHDFIFSNHRCHGHYIAFTGDYEGLIAELLGKKAGTCGGIGSSQHLCHRNFFSNGIQGGIVPVAAGYALGNKLKKNNNIGIVFIGDGTLGEGVLYETMNIISKWEIPLMIVCENNSYAQTTPVETSIAGDIAARAKAFGIETFESNTWDVEQLLIHSQKSIQYVRDTGKPAFHHVKTYRLNAHSKGDDTRDSAEVEAYRKKDFLNCFAESDREYYQKYSQQIDALIENAVNHHLNGEELTLSEYFPKEKLPEPTEWHSPEDMVQRQVTRINKFFLDAMAVDPRIVFIGEDVLSPYGGAFKVAKELSSLFPDRVFSTPISEAAIAGIANGLALNGFRPYAEIMFGDFTTLAMDQIVNHASKFYHMFNHKVTCPVVFRTPMGGRRGYGPTHSQTLDRFLTGIDHVKTIALNIITDPSHIYSQILEHEEHPVIVIENKTDYGKKIGKRELQNYTMEISGHRYPIVRYSPVKSKPTVTLVTYGGMTDIVLNSIDRIFTEADQKCEILILSQIHPLPVDVIVASVSTTQNIITVEEGSPAGGIGSEIIASVAGNCPLQKTLRIAGLPVPIPSVKSLENQVLPDENRIVQSIKEHFNV